MKHVKLTFAVAAICALASAFEASGGGKPSRQPKGKQIVPNGYGVAYVSPVPAAVGPPEWYDYRPPEIRIEKYFDGTHIYRNGVEKAVIKTYDYTTTTGNYMQSDNIGVDVGLFEQEESNYRCAPSGYYIPPRRYRAAEWNSDAEIQAAKQRAVVRQIEQEKFDKQMKEMLKQLNTIKQKAGK